GVNRRKWFPCELERHFKKRHGCLISQGAADDVARDVTRQEAFGQKAVAGILFAPHVLLVRRPQEGGKQRVRLRDRRPPWSVAWWGLREHFEEAEREAREDLRHGQFGLAVGRPIETGSLERFGFLFGVGVGEFAALQEDGQDVDAGPKRSPVRAVASPETSLVLHDVAARPALAANLVGPGVAEGHDRSIPLREVRSPLVAAWFDCQGG